MKRTLWVLCITVITVFVALQLLTVGWWRARGLHRTPGMSLVPRDVDQIGQPPDNWEEVSVGDLRLRLPMHEVEDVRSPENTMSLLFNLTRNRLIAFDYERAIAGFEGAEDIPERLRQHMIVSYAETETVCRSQPSDISFLRPFWRNRRTMIHQILKAIGPGAYEIDIVDPTVMRAISEKRSRKGSHSASVTVWTENGINSLSILLGGYGDTEYLDAEVYQILGGLTMPSGLLDGEAVRHDVEQIISAHGKEEEG